MNPNNNTETQIQSTGWIIDARWYYAPLAFFLGLIAREHVDALHTTEILIASVLIVLLCNATFYFYLRKLKNGVGDTEMQVVLLNTAQIALDMLFFFVVILFTGGGVESVGHSFFFVPIIVSTIIFGLRGGAAIAVVSGTLVLLSVLAHAGAFPNLFAHTGDFELTKELSLLLTQVGIVFMIYLLVGFFGGYISKLVRARDLELLAQLRKEEAHVKRLEELTREFDQSAKLLVRRDLELTNVNEKLTQLDQMKSEVVSIVAHQLRTPLAAIKWTLKLLLDGEGGAVSHEQRELLQKGYDSNERMILLVNDMLSVDRIESGRVRYNFVPVQFELLLQETLHTLLPIATRKNIRVELDVPASPLPKIKVDPDKIRDVIQNLIDNAIKYTGEGGLVTLGLKMDGHALHFWVSDNGIGIPEQEKDKIFLRFFRAGNAVHAHTDGSGLGLFIVEAIVKRHGGRTWFESIEHKSTTFHVLLPFTP